MHLPRAIVVPGAALTAIGLSAVAFAQAQQRVVDPVCADTPSCVAINGFADPGSDGAEHSLSQFDQAIATFGRPASECPQATAAYAAVGIAADAVLGPCPDPSTYPDPDEFVPDPFGADQGGK